tara:strand:+ start:148 stop:375 length:228 start_codon:yes stop_codon:yes gene_type:complete
MIRPGHSLVHSKVKQLMKNPDCHLLKIEAAEGAVIKKTLDDYLMYIWMFLGDTRYNKSGYRKAFENLSHYINKNF